MAGYFLLVKTFSRGKGNSATKAAAYRSGERIRDERSGAVHDYTDRTDVAHAEIVLPAQYAGHVDMEWALNRHVLWNAVQQSGRNWNTRLAREVLLHVPPEMTRAQRVAPWFDGFHMSWRIGITRRWTSRSTNRVRRPISDIITRIF